MKRQIGEKTQRIKAERKIQKDKKTEERRKDKKA